MSSLAPNWALSAQAIDVVSDPHLAKGVHLRLLPGAALGLPILPFRVARVNLGQPGALPAAGQPDTPGVFRSKELVFADSTKKLLQPPFNISPNKPVTLHMPLPQVGSCCWVGIVTEPLPLPTLTVLSAEAQVMGDQGPSCVARTLVTPWHLSASRIDRVLLTGAARIMGAWWIDAAQLSRYVDNTPWRLWSLPIAGSHLYTPTTTAPADATERVARGAPLRRPMYQAPDVASPAVAPTIANPAAAEQQRLAAASLKAKAWLDSLLAQGIDAPHQRSRESFTAGKSPVKLSMSLLDGLWLASLDPGLSRWLGFGDVDELPGGKAGDVQAYVVSGLWQQGLGPQAQAALLSQLSPAKLDALDKRSGANAPAMPSPPGAKPPFFDLYTVACVTLGKASMAPATPAFDGVELKPYLPALPPEARREVVLKIKGLVPGPGAALARKSGGSWLSLNPLIDGQPVGLVVSRPPDPALPGYGRLSDRQAPPEAVSYRLAQSDWFGRWSTWAELAVAKLDRPRPPQPVLQVAYLPPDAALWGQGGALAGSFSVLVPVPPNDALAPGSKPLTHLKLQVGATTATLAVASANAKGDMVVAVPGPTLPPCGSATVTITGQWLAGPDASDPAQPIVRQVHDPRAPPPVTMPFTLDYASRPDATGKSRIDLRWTASATQKRFRVYYASETSLRAQLLAVSPKMAALVSEGLDAPDRALAFQQLKANFKREWFESLSRDAIEKTADGQMTFVHEVSGQLATLGFYRIASVSEANVEGDFAATPMVAFAVPNLSPPAMPLLDVALDPETLTAKLSLRVPRGAVPARWFRLRRTTGAALDASQMLVRYQDKMPHDPGDQPTQQAQLTDAPLKPWKRYSWRVEVRGADLPGGNAQGQALLGMWSRASEPAELVVIPPAPPLPVHTLQSKRSGASVTLSFIHAQAPLVGGAMGRYRVEIYRALQGDRERLLTALWADAPPEQGGFDAQQQASFTDTQAELEAVSYRVLVFDPIDRSSIDNPTIALPTTLPKGA